MMTYFSTHNNNKNNAVSKKKNIMPQYKITLTARGGLSEENIAGLVKYFREKCTHAYIVNEFGESGGNSHLEGIVELAAKKTSNLTRSIKTLYEKMGIEVVPRVTIVVKTVTHLGGAMSYASKELREKGELALLLGWEQTWIQKKIDAVVANKAPKTLLSLGHWVSKRLGPAEIYTWCKAHNCEIHNKQEYREVIVRMGNEQYMFDKGMHKCTLANVMALFGDGSGLGKIVDEECFFLQL